MDYITQLLKKVIKDIFTGIDGLTFDPARIVGYGTASVGVLGFASDTLIHLIQKGALDAKSFGIEFAALSGGLAAIAAGVSIKSNSEPTAIVTVNA